MSVQNPVRADQPEVRQRLVSMQGPGSTLPTKVYGQGVTLSRTGAGVYKMTFNENPGAFVAATAQVRATTMSGVANFDVALSNWDSTNFAISLTLYNASAVATDLASNQWIDVVILVKEAGVSAP